MRFTFLLLALAAVPATGAEESWSWITGVVTEVSKGHTDTGATARGSAQSVETGPSTATASGTSTVTLTGINYTDYTVRVDNKLFVMRPDPLRPKEHVAWKILRYSTVLNSEPPPPIPVAIPANVGDKVDIALFGDQAFVRYRNRQYICTVVRQVLLSAPDTRQDRPQDNATQPAPPAN